jgi:hypothetical protein
MFGYARWLCGFLFIRGSISAATSAVGNSTGASSAGGVTAEGGIAGCDLMPA